MSWSGHHFSYCWSCEVPLVHGSYTFAMFRWCSPLSQWCLSCLITIRYSVIWCYLMLIGYSLVIKRGLLENPYRFFSFSGNLIYSTWVFARGYMGCTWNCGRSLARFVQACEILDQHCTSQNQRWTESCLDFFKVAQSHSFRWNFRPTFLNIFLKTVFPSAATAPPGWWRQELRARLPRLQELAELREARRLLRQQLGGAEALKLGSWAMGPGKQKILRVPGGFEDLEHYPLVI